MSSIMSCDSEKVHRYMNKYFLLLLLFYFLPQIVEKETGLTSLRIRAEKEKELQEAEAYWSKRFAKQEQEVRITITYI